jgi:hypothetical protein
MYTYNNNETSRQELHDILADGQIQVKWDFTDFLGYYDIGSILADVFDFTFDTDLCLDYDGWRIVRRETDEDTLCLEIDIDVEQAVSDLVDELEKGLSAEEAACLMFDMDTGDISIKLFNLIKKSLT